MCCFKLCSLECLWDAINLVTNKNSRIHTFRIRALSPPTDFYFYFHYFLSCIESHTNLCALHISFDDSDSHLYRQFNDYRGYKLDHTGPQMILTMKLTSWAFNVYDGRRNPKVLYLVCMFV